MRNHLFSCKEVPADQYLSPNKPECYEYGVAGSHGSALSPQLSLVRGALPMFELVERQPSHFSNPDVLNLTPGEAVQGGRAKGSLSL